MFRIARLIRDSDLNAPLKRRTRLFGAVLLLSLACLTGYAEACVPTDTESTNAGSVTPERIFNRATDAWTFANGSATMNYTVTVSAFQSDGRVVRKHYAAVFFEGDGTFKVSRFSAEENAKPAGPRGINVELSLGGQTTLKRLSRDPEPSDILGFPSLSPRYSFGIARDTPSDVESTPDESADLRVIGRVSIDRPHYRATLVGIDCIDSLPAYHLALEPLREPKNFRLREMWVDEKTFETRKIATDGNFAKGPALGVPWTITFRSIGHQQYLRLEESEAPLAWESARYRRVTISFDDFVINAGASSPPVIFRLPDADEQLSEP